MISKSKYNFLQLDWGNEASTYSKLFCFGNDNIFSPLPIKNYLNDSYDFIFAGDILYETKHYESLLELFSKRLNKGGLVVIITKYFYYGNRGKYF